MARSSRAGPVGPAFFDRPTPEVARALLGSTVRFFGTDGERAVRLVEVEAYLVGDPASHAFRGPTRRNRSMFAGPGTLYVFRIHQVVCANVVTRRGEAVLFRAASPVRPAEANPTGPGRLCRVLGVTLADDGTPVGSGRWELEAAPVGRARTVVGPRVGISRAVERPLRFAVRGDPWVSRPRPPVT